MIPTIFSLLTFLTTTFAAPTPIYSTTTTIELCFGIENINSVVTNFCADILTDNQERAISALNFDDVLNGRLVAQTVKAGNPFPDGTTCKVKVDVEVGRVLVVDRTFEGQLQDLDPVDGDAVDVFGGSVKCDN